MIKTHNDAAYELIRCAIHFSDPHRDTDHDGYFNSVLNDSRAIIIKPVFEVKISQMNRGIDYQIVITHQSGQFTMRKVSRAFDVYNWLEGNFYGNDVDQLRLSGAPEER